MSAPEKTCRADVVVKVKMVTRKSAMVRDLEEVRQDLERSWAQRIGALLNDGLLYSEVDVSVTLEEDA